MDEWNMHDEVKSVVSTSADELLCNNNTRHSSRKRTSPVFFVPPNWGPTRGSSKHKRSVSANGQANIKPAKRGPGRPPKPRPVSADGQVTLQPVKRRPGRPPRERPVSEDGQVNLQPVKRRPGRPPRDRPISADVFGDATSQPVRRGPGRRPKNRPVSAEAPSMAVTETPAVTLRPVPPLGSRMDTPILIPCDEDVGYRETNVNLDPMSLLSRPPKPPRLEGESSAHIDKDHMSRISNAQSLLVFLLTSGETKNVEDMVKCANNTFYNLDKLHADYSSFHKDVKDFIEYHHDLLTVERQRDMRSVLEMKRRYEDAKIRANDLKDEIDHTQGQVEIVIKKKEPLEKAIEEAMEMIGRLKKSVAVLEQDEEALKQKKQKCITDHELAKHEVQILHTQVEQVENELREIDQRKNAALKGIESTTHRLKNVLT